MFGSPEIEKDGYRYYGKWGGNPRGARENKDHCIAECYENWTRRFYQCTRKRGHGPNGDYCKQHAKRAKP